MSEKKPVVVQPAPVRPICPVCGKPSYSAGGTHPQCSQSRADALSVANRKKTVAAPVKAKAKTKPCPKCKREIAVRRYSCDCGHRFTPSAVGAEANDA